MRKIFAGPLLLLAAFGSLLLSSCFDVREEVWIHADGSGRAGLHYTIPETATLLAGGPQGIERQIRELIASQPPLKLDRVEVTANGRTVEISLEISTGSILSLLDLKKSESMKKLPSSAGDIFGNFDVRIHALDVDLNRTVRVNEALGLAALGISREERDRRRLVCIVHLPKPAKESNATSTADGGRTLIWDHTLGEALEGPLLTHFRARMPLPRWVVPSVCAVAFALVSGALWLRRRLKAVRAGPERR